MVTFKYTHMVTPRIRNPFFAENFVLKGGGEGVPPTSVTFFGDQNQVSSLGKKTQFSALFEDIFLGNVLKGEGGGTTLKSVTFYANFVRKEGRGAPITDKIRKVVFDIAPKGSHRSKNTGIL